MKCVRDLCAMSELALVKRLSDEALISVSFAPAWRYRVSCGDVSMMPAKANRIGLSDRLDPSFEEPAASGAELGREYVGPHGRGSELWGADQPLGWQVMKVESRSRSIRPWVLLVSILTLFFCAVVGWSQTAVTISNSVETPGIARPGINLGGLGGYGSQQLFKSLNYVNGGYFPGTYAATTFPCRGGGSNTTTSWYNDITNPGGYPANFWAGATFVAINAATGASYGSGVVTASTANTGAAGITFTLSPAMSSACDPSQNDVIIVRSTASANSQLTPYQVLNNHICSNATWDIGDTSPSSSNTQQSLEMPNGCGLTFYIDATVSNRTNTNPGLASQQVNSINLNGSYNATFKAKCLVSGCSVNFNLGRLGGTTFVGSTTVSPASAAPGAGWTTYTYPFSASENDTQDQTIGFSFSCTGTCLLQDADVIEGSTLPGNTTAFRDAVVYELQKIHPGSIRYMDSSQWCSDVADEIATTGNRRWCGASDYGPGVGQPIGYNDVLALANFLGSDVLISVGQLNQPSDWTMLINWLNSSGWISTYANSGHTIYLEDGNEAWNSGVGATLYFGNGTAYGYTLGPNMAAAKAASGYNSSVIKLVGNSWVAGSQGYGPFGWIHNSLTVAQGTPNGLPDFVDDAPYTLNYLGNFNTSGGNVATNGAPFVDEFAEDANIDSVTSPPLYTQSMYLNQQYAKSNFGVNTLVYEVNQSTIAGVPATQLQLDQVGASVGNALSTAEHVLLMQRDSQVTGPIHVFTLAEPYTGYSCNGCNGPVMPLWGTNHLMATGPGQIPGALTADRPLTIALEVINNAIGSNNNLMSITQTGTPTYSYPGGQVQGSSNSISPNNAVPYVNCFSYSNGASAWTTICFNNNLTTAESVNFSGAGAPSGSVSETIFPGPSNVITDHNENTYLGSSSIAPVVTLPSAITTSGTSYSIPPASMIALTYTTGGTQSTPTLGTPTFTPGGGNYSGTQTVTISFPSGSTGCVGINSTPTASTAGTCGSGGTTYAGPITVNSSETLNAIATEVGFINSAAGTATYTLTVPTVATPTFSLAGGTYTTSQSVTISDATAGATIYYTTNGTTPTTSSNVYSGAITVSSSETLEAVAVKNGFTTSAPATAVYTISATLPAPTFSPGGGSYAASQSVTISDATPGTTIYYTTNGTTPTTSSSVYGSAITVSSSETLQAIAVKAGFTTSAAASAGYTIAPVTTFTPTVSTSCYQGSGANSLTMGPINTSGANAIAIVVASFGVISTVTDNLGNGNATGLPAASGNSPNNQIFYWQNPNVGSGQTFTVNGNSGLYASACVFVMSGINGVYSGAQSSSTAGYASNTCQAGSITPGSGPQIVITGFGTYTPNGIPTLDGSYTVGGYQAGAGGAAFGEAAGYLIQPSGAATNPKWNWTNKGSSPGCVIAAFGGGGGVPTAATPTFSPGAGTYTSALPVTISDGTPGTTIYYTTNGTTPTTSSSVYGGPITVSSSETLEAIAVESGFTTSAPATAAYTINAITTGNTYINFGSGQFTGSSFYLNGGATVTNGGALQMTDGGNSEVRSAWFNTRVPVTNFVTDFTFQLLNPKADGLVFVIQGQGPAALGSGGPGLAYQGITNSVAVKFDLFNNAGEGGNSTGLYIGGASPTVPSVDLGTTGINLHSGHIIDAHMVYDGTNLTVTLIDTVTSASVVEVFPVDIPTAVGGSTAYVGFTGGTGTFTSTQDVLTWSYVSSGGTGTPTAASPTFSPGAGTYTTSQSVTIGDATPGTTIYYTTNGTTPTTSSNVYGGAITVSASETLQAIAVEAGYTTSAAAAAVYVINPIPTTLTAPSFSPAGGTYTTSQSVSISDATTGTTIYYTTNGTTPTTSSSIYSGAIAVSSSEILEAIAVRAGYTTSPAATAAYTINTGVTGGAPAVSTTCYQGSSSSSLTTGPIDTSGASAIAIVVASFNNILTVTDNKGNGNATGLTAASGGSPNNQIFYWQTPNVGSGHTITVNGGGGLYASACVFVMSGITGTYSGAQSANSAGYASSTCQAGSIAPASGPQIVITGFGVYSPTGIPTIDSSYTLGAYQPGAGGTAFGEAAGYLIQPSGSATNPRWNWGSGASSPGCVIAAFGGGAGVPIAATPTFSPAAGTYTTSQPVTISNTTPGTTIYYTTNGTTPTTSSSVYSGPITVSSSETLQAIAVKSGFNTSAPAAAVYSINTGTSGSSTYISLASGQFAASSFYLNGGATVTPAGALQVTDGGYGEGRSAWFSNQVPVANFVTDFTFQVPYANADGMAFVIQARGSNALGGTGGSLGYQGINNSVAVKFDLYDNGGEGIDSTGLYTGGASPVLPSVDLNKTGINLHSGHIMAAHIVYDGTNLTMTLTDTVTAASVVEVFPVNIPAAVGGSTAYVGFTGGTGGLASMQNVLTWSYVTNP